jgi:sec-independent protein translocase protein TatA
MIYLFIVPGGFEIAVVALVILLLFGGKKIPALFKGIGNGITEFKKGIKNINE